MRAAAGGVEVGGHPGSGRLEWRVQATGEGAQPGLKRVRRL